MDSFMDEMRMSAEGVMKAGKSMRGERKDKVFGQPIDPESDLVPPFLLLCSSYLEKHSSCTLQNLLLKLHQVEREGIFRISGNLISIMELKQRFDRGEEIDLSQIPDPHTVSGVFKRWFRELPEPLLTYDLYDMFIAATGIKDQQTQLKQVKKVLEYLPLGNLIVVLFLVGFLRKVCEKSAINKMTANNLAIVFAPSLLRNRSDDLEIAIHDTPRANSLLTMFITNFEDLFRDFNLQPVSEKKILRVADGVGAVGTLASSLTSSNSEEAIIVKKDRETKSKLTQSLSNTMSKVSLTLRHKKRAEDEVASLPTEPSTEPLTSTQSASNVSPSTSPLTQSQSSSFQSKASHQPAAHSPPNFTQTTPLSQSPPASSASFLKPQSQFLAKERNATHPPIFKIATPTPRAKDDTEVAFSRKSFIGMDKERPTSKSFLNFRTGGRGQVNPYSLSVESLRNLVQKLKCPEEEVMEESSLYYVNSNFKGSTLIKWIVVQENVGSSEAQFIASQLLHNKLLTPLNSDAAPFSETSFYKF